MIIITFYGLYEIVAFCFFFENIEISSKIFHFNHFSHFSTWRMWLILNYGTYWYLGL